MLTISNLHERMKTWVGRKNEPFKSQKQVKETLQPLMNALDTEDVYEVFKDYDRTVSALKTLYSDASLKQRLKILYSVITRLTKEEIEEHNLMLNKFVSPKKKLGTNLKEDEEMVFIEDASMTTDTTEELSEIDIEQDVNKVDAMYQLKVEYLTKQVETQNKVIKLLVEQCFANRPELNKLVMELLQQ